jgi:hypothetical protein
MTRPGEISTMNHFMVGRMDNSAAPLVTILNPPHGTMTVDEALTLAAWLVVVASLGETDRFNEILAAVLSI